MAMPDDQTTTNQSPQDNLEDLKRRLDSAQDVHVDPSGKLVTQSGSDSGSKSTQKKTVIKPQRWFARMAE